MISIIIPTHNSASTIQQCISSITSQIYPKKNYEIILVDDGSTDETLNLVKDMGANKIIKVDPCFQGKARNIGANNAKGNVLAFIDSDCAADKDWLKTIEKEIETNESIGGPVLNGNNHSLIAWAEYLMEFSEFNEYKQRGIIPFIASCNQVCTKKSFLLVDGFPENKLSEDVYLGNSFKNAGIKLLFVPELQIKHFCRTKLKKFLANMELLGSFSVKTGKEVSSIYSGRLHKSRSYIPIVFGIKFLARARRAVQAKKFLIFLVTLPLILLGTGAFCKGVWKEIGHHVF